MGDTILARAPDRDPMDMTVRKTARYRLAEALAGIVAEDAEFDLG